MLLWHSIGVEFELHPALRDAANGYIEEDDWIGVVQLLHAVYHGFIRHLFPFYARERW